MTKTLRAAVAAGAFATLALCPQALAQRRDVAARVSKQQILPMPTRLILLFALAAALVLVLLIPATWYAGHVSAGWLGGFSLFAYYGAHFLEIFLIIVASGIILGGAASILAIRRYITV